MNSFEWLKLKNGEWRAGGQFGQFIRFVSDGPGTYEIPYLQTERTLEFEVSPWPVGVMSLEWELVSPTKGLHYSGRIEPDSPRGRIDGLVPSEYSWRVTPAGNGPTYEFSPIGVGTVIAALGDSITEGYWGRGYASNPTRLAAHLFPMESVSRDTRNFPQYAPTTSVYAPGITCFESWMSRLNDQLSAAWNSPVFIANEGWGGYTTADYLRLIDRDQQWQDRLHRLAPQIWLIHLGVNDERAHRSSTEFGGDLRTLVDRLGTNYGADPSRIFIARPCYDYWEQATEFLMAYIGEIDRIRADFGLPEGPDFYAAYAEGKERWYGADPVHPNVAGMDYMGDLWGRAMLRSLPTGVGN
jgi:lysophospholipase L1-like esterase